MTKKRGFPLSDGNELFEKIYSLFLSAIEKYGLVEKGDRIAVCVSGGKDSMLESLLFKRYGEENHDISVRYICMDPGYVPKNREMIENNARKLDIPLDIFETRIFDSVARIEKSPCYLCARMRRGWLYRHAKECGCNKIALGHHFDDVIETVLLSVLYSGQYQTMLPKITSSNFDGMSLIRPMYLIREKDIIKWRDDNNLRFLRCACRFTADAADDEHLSKRSEMKRLIERLEKEDSKIPYNIFNSTHNVILDEIMTAEEKNNEKTSFEN